MFAKINNVITELSSRAETDGSIILVMADQTDLKAIVDAIEQTGELSVYEDEECQHQIGLYRYQRLTRATIWAGTGEVELEFVTQDIPQLEADELREKNDMLEACILEMSELLYA